jgi:UDP-N-acetylglucosamine 1-carboxyvinyltransferase
LIIRGGNRLVGTVDVAGSKNTALAIMSAVVLGEGVTTLTNVPMVSDTRIKAQILEAFGAVAEWEGSTLRIDCTNMREGNPDPELVQKIRTSFYLLGPLLARVGKVTLPAPGGCNIGARPVDFHLKGLALLGANVELHSGHYVGEAKQMHGAEIYLDFPSAGATQHLMTAAVLAKGNTVIQNAAMEPEVTSLASFLQMMGARIEGAGTSTITIGGVSSLKGCLFRIPADRMQASTYLLAAAITGGDVAVRGIIPETQTALAQKMREAGAEVFEDTDLVRLRSDARLNGIKVKTMPYPGFPTDIQQPAAAVLSLASGQSVIEETIYENRIGHIRELNRMGAKIAVNGRSAIIDGVDSLEGTVVEASDLRAGAALVLAGLAAKGETRVRNVHFIDRGYERFEETLVSLGADVRRIGTLSERR